MSPFLNIGKKSSVGKNKNNCNIQITKKLLNYYFFFFFPPSIKGGRAMKQVYEGNHCQH